MRRCIKLKRRRQRKLKRRLRRSIVRDLGGAFEAFLPATVAAQKAAVRGLFDAVSKAYLHELVIKPLTAELFRRYVAQHGAPRP